MTAPLGRVPPLELVAVALLILAMAIAAGAFVGLASSGESIRKVKTTCQIEGGHVDTV